MKKAIFLLKIKKPDDSYTESIIVHHGILEALGYEVMYSDYDTYNQEEFYNSVKEYQPNFVIICAYHAIHIELIKLREFTKVYVMQPAIVEQAKDYARYWMSCVDGTICYGDMNIINEINTSKVHKFIQLTQIHNPLTMSNAAVDLSATAIHDWNDILPEVDSEYKSKSRAEIDALVNKIAGR